MTGATPGVGGVEGKGHQLDAGQHHQQPTPRDVIDEAYRALRTCLNQPVNPAGGQGSAAAVSRPYLNRPTRGRYGRRRQWKTRLDGRRDVSWRDPQTFGDVLKRETRQRGWEKRVAVHRIMNEWENLVGPEAAKHSVPVRFDEEQRRLIVQCDSSTWATQLRNLQTVMLRQFREKLGPDVVTEVKLLRPQNGPKLKGRLRVQGRGPRDDYG